MATLKISDPSVGDWVRYKGKECTIASIYGHPHEVALTYQGICYGCAYIDHLEPIPITAEILEKNGFTRRSSEFPIYEYATLLGKMLRTTVVSLNHPYSYIVCRIEDTSKELHEVARISINLSIDRSPVHIHDLQHALRLAGVDKEINL